MVIYEKILVCYSWNFSYSWVPEQNCCEHAVPYAANRSNEESHHWRHKVSVMRIWFSLLINNSLEVFACFGLAVSHSIFIWSLLKCFIITQCFSFFQWYIVYIDPLSTMWFYGSTSKILKFILTALQYALLYGADTWWMLGLNTEHYCFFNLYHVCVY